MISVLDAAQARAADQAASVGLGLPSYALMELASKGLAEVVARRPEAVGRIVVACGPGQNGGDGYGCARWLHRMGHDVSVMSTSEASPGDAGLARQAARRAGVPTTSTLDGASLLVDALFGTGLSRPVEGEYAGLVRAMEAHAAPVVSADLPSGLHADTGTILGVALRAVQTVTFGASKPGLYTGEGPSLAGKVTVVELGLDTTRRAAEVVEPRDLVAAWPQRRWDDHKRRAGHLLVIAGSEAMAGAAVLCCRGALSAGVGLVTLLAPERAVPRLGALPPEVMVVVRSRGLSRWDGALPDLDAYSAIAVGPGLGEGEPLRAGVAEAIATLCATSNRPIVCDADAIAHACAGPAERVITPHEGEAARALGRSTAEVVADRFGAVRDLATPGLVALLKGPRTLVARRGDPVRINTTGHPILATGGTGDVLTGMVGALLARGVGAREAATVAAWVHGRAGELCAGRQPWGRTAGDVAAAIPDAIEALMYEGDALPRRGDAPA